VGAQPNIQGNEFYDLGSSGELYRLFSYLMRLHLRSVKQKDVCCGLWGLVTVGANVGAELSAGRAAASPLWVPIVRVEPVVWVRDEIFAVRR